MWQVLFGLDLLLGTQHQIGSDVARVATCVAAGRVGRCSLLSELARASYEYHEQMAKSGIAPWLTRLGGEKGVGGKKQRSFSREEQR